MRRPKHEHGFTLVELLVVIIIIGILAAVAIPAFMNQRQRATDAATISDVKNMAGAVHEALIITPDAGWFGTATGTGGLILAVGPSYLDVGPAHLVPMTKGTRMRVEPIPGRIGEFRIFAYNVNGKRYNLDSSTLEYNSDSGGIQVIPANKTGSTFGISQ